MRKLKIFGIACVMIGTAILGDSCNVNDRFVNPIVYRNTSIEPTSYQKPFKIQKRYTKNEKGMLEVQIGYKENWHKISREMRVNERGLDQMLKDQGEEIAKTMKEKYRQNEPIIKGYVNKVIELYKDIFRMEDGNNK